MRRPARPTLLLGRMLIDIDKLRALQLLQRRRQCDQRHKDEYQCINRHAEQNRMHQRVQPLDAKKGLRAQPIETEQAKLNHCVREKHPPAKLGKNNVKSQIKNPHNNPESAPMRVAPRQKIPPNIAGKTCTTPAKDTNPIEVRAAPLPER